MTQLKKPFLSNEIDGSIYKIDTIAKREKKVSQSVGCQVDLVLGRETINKDSNSVGWLVLIFQLNL